jgi:hypothetical protein
VARVYDGRMYPRGLHACARGRAPLGIALAAVLVLIATTGGAGAQPERQHAGATLMPRSLDPFTVKGSGFKRRERVRVTVTQASAEAGVTKRVRARRDGSFSVTFESIQACDGLEGVAVGRRGSRASFQFSALTCPGF